MPYDIVKKGTGYTVKNLDTGHEFSKKGIPKSRAKAQMRLLYGVEHGMVVKGKDKSKK